jgi:hypothetical protein
VPVENVYTAERPIRPSSELKFIMEKAWISVGSTTTGSVIDPLTAACEDGFVPDTVYLLGNPSIDHKMGELADMTSEVIEVYDEEPEIKLRETETETSFDELYLTIRDCIEEAQEQDSEVAVNFTPGRKFMTAIAFQTGMKCDVEHLYYFHIHSSDNYGKSYPEIPRTAADLIDFREEM